MSQTPATKAIVFDQDGGIDDFLSLLMLLCMPHIELRGLVVTPADCYLRPAVAATQKILRLFDRADIPLSRGQLCGQNPFPRDWRAHAYQVDALPLLNESDEPLLEPVAEPGHHFIARQLEEAPQPLTLLITGPLTNLAAALEADPGLAANIAEVVWMGGAIDVPGNVRDYEHDGSAEWNAYWDPAATHRLWQSDVPLRLFPLDATNHVPVTLDFLKRLARQRRFPISDLAGQCWAMSLGTIPAAEYIYYMWDTLTTGYLGLPDSLSFRSLRTEALADGPAAGRIQAVEQGGKLIQVADKVDVPRFHQYVLDLLRR